MIRKVLASAILLCINFAASSQRTIPATDSISVVGMIKDPLTFTISDFETYPTVDIEDVVIYNHEGEIKDTLTHLKGISLKTLLASIEYVYEKPKLLNEFYFVFIASDGYQVVFSWNEIYNTSIGDKLFVVTEMDGRSRKEIEQRIAVLSTGDIQVGRRYIKGLQRIEVRQI